MSDIAKTLLDGEYTIEKTIAFFAIGEEHFVTKELARFTADTIECQRARIKKLEDRLEVYSTPDAHGKRIYLDIGNCDGIGCRDETIKLLDKRIESLEEGECRFHCRMRKDMWVSGLVVGFTWDGEGTYEEQYIKWRTEHEKKK